MKPTRSQSLGACEMRDARKALLGMIDSGKRRDIRMRRVFGCGDTVTFKTANKSDADLLVEAALAKTHEALLWTIHKFLLEAWQPAERWRFDLYALCGFLAPAGMTIEEAWEALDRQQIALAVRGLGDWEVHLASIYYPETNTAKSLREMLPVPDAEDLRVATARARSVRKGLYLKAGKPPWAVTPAGKQRAAMAHRNPTKRARLSPKRPAK